MPRYTILDNATAMVVRASATDPGLNRSFREYAESRGFFPDTARVRHPKDKARVENQVCCRAGFNVRFQRADDLLRILKQSRMDNSRNALMTQLATVDVLIIDDFALEPMTRDESRDVYQLFVDRNGRFSTIVTSNRDTAEWIATFDDALLALSAVDRFKNNAFDLVVDGESYRSRLKPNIEAMGPPPSAPVKKVPVHPRRRAPPRRS